MPPPCSLSSRARTVAGTPNSRDLTGARAPLLSHTTARSRQASTSFESQATRAGRRLESQPAGTPQRYEPGSLPSRPGPATPTYNWAVMLSARLDRYYGRLRLPPGTPPASRLLTGYRTARIHGHRSPLRPGRASPVPAATI